MSLTKETCIYTKETYIHTKDKYGVFFFCVRSLVYVISLVCVFAGLFCMYVGLFGCVGVVRCVFV